LDIFGGIEQSTFSEYRDYCQNILTNSKFIFATQNYTFSMNSIL